jgi:ankyrin repeat protein
MFTLPENSRGKSDKEITLDNHIIVQLDDDSTTVEHTENLNAIKSSKTIKMIYDSKNKAAKVFVWNKENRKFELLEGGVNSLQSLSGKTKFSIIGHGERQVDSMSISGISSLELADQLKNIISKVDFSESELNLNFVVCELIRLGERPGDTDSYVGNILRSLVEDETEERRLLIFEKVSASASHFELMSLVGFSAAKKNLRKVTSAIYSDCQFVMTS